MCLIVKAKYGVTRFCKGVHGVQGILESPGKSLFCSHFLTSTIVHCRLALRGAHFLDRNDSAEVIGDACCPSTRP